MKNIFHVSVSNRGDTDHTKLDNFYNRIGFVQGEQCCCTGETSNMKIRGDLMGHLLFVVGMIIIDKINLFK